MSRKQSRTALSKRDFLVVRSSTDGSILKVVTPQHFQIGLDDSDFRKVLVVKGIVRAEMGLSGSLTRLMDGTSYLRAGTNIQIITGSKGEVTINSSLTGTPNALSAGDALSFIGGGNYDTSAHKTLNLDIDGLSSALPAGADTVAIYDATATTIKKASLTDILALGTSTTLSNPLTMGDGIALVSGNTDYDNSVAETIMIDLGSNPGLEFSSNKLVVKLDGSTLSLAAAGLSVAGVPNALTQGTGIATFSYDGSSAGTTVGIDTTVVPRLSNTNIFSDVNTFSAISGGSIIGSIQEVSPGTDYLVAGSNVTITKDSPGAGQITIAASIGAGSALSDGDGIATFSYNGSAPVTISAEAKTNAGLAVDSSGIAFDFTNLAGATADRTQYVLVGESGSPSTVSRVAASTLIDLVDRSVVVSEAPSGGITVTYPGATDAALVSVKRDGTTLSVGASGLSVAKVPNALSQGPGIKTFSFDGSSATTVAIDTSVIPTLTGSNIFLDNVVFKKNVGITGSLDTKSHITTTGNITTSGIITSTGGITGSLTEVSSGLQFIKGAEGVNITTGSNGQITIDVPAATGGTITGVTAGTGLLGGGTSGIVTLNVNNSVVATLTGSQFTGGVGMDTTLGITGSLMAIAGNIFGNARSDLQQFTGSAEFKNGLSGSLTHLDDGTSYLRAGTNITIATSSNGSVTINSTASGTGISYFTSPTSGYINTTGSAVFAGGRGASYIASSVGTDAFFFVSGSLDSKDTLTRGTAVFGGDVVVSGTLHGGSPLKIDGGMEVTGSVELKPKSGTVAIIRNPHGPVKVFANTILKLGAGGGIIDLLDLEDGAAGQMVLTGSGPTSSRSVELNSPGTLYFTGSAGGSKFKGPVRAYDGLSGSLTQLTDGTSYLRAGSNVTITSGTNGAITISAAAGGGDISVVSGSTSVSSVTTLNFSNAGLIQDIGSDTIAITGSIGPAEDGSYSDGLFTDFNPNTTVGTAVDRFNEVLKGLAPSAAPTLDDVGCNDSGTAAKLSFGSSQSISGYTNAQPSTLSPSSGLSDTDINQSYNIDTVSNDLQRACFKTAPIINGSLNADVAADSPNYAADSFGDGDQGTLRLYVNNNSTEIHSVDLSTFGSGDSLNGDGSGFNLSAVTNGAFSDGSAFSTFKHRQGTYIIASASQRDGWNYARITHTVGSSVNTTNYVEWVIAPNNVALSSAGSAMDSLSMTGTKYLSGVKYNTGGSAEYRIRVSNAYRNTYSTSNITYNGTNCSIPATSFPIIDYGAGENESKVLHLTGSVTVTGDPILDGSITASTNVPHPLKTNLSSAGSQSISGILLYGLSDTSSATSETFRGESYRLISGSYNTQANVTDAANAWDSTTSLNTVNGLLYYNSRLYSPLEGGDNGDFRNTSDGGTITNGPSSNPNYSTITGTRTFYRKFQNNSGGSKTNFDLTINGSGTIVSHGTSLSASNLHVFIKLPQTSDPFSTGWMDLATAFATGQVNDGDGCLVGSLDSSLNATNEATFGTESVGDNEYVMVLIKADASFTGYISSMSVSWS